MVTLKPEGHLPSSGRDRDERASAYRAAVTCLPGASLLEPRCPLMCKAYKDSLLSQWAGRSFPPSTVVAKKAENRHCKAWLCCVSQAACLNVWSIICTLLEEVKSLGSVPSESSESRCFRGQLCNRISRGIFLKFKILSLPSANKAKSRKLNT